LTISEAKRLDRAADDRLRDLMIEQSGGGWVSVLINASPFLLLLAFWVFMMRQMQNRRPPPTPV